MDLLAAWNGSTIKFASFIRACIFLYMCVSVSVRMLYCLCVIVCEIIKHQPEQRNNQRRCHKVNKNASAKNNCRESGGRAITREALPLVQLATALSLHIDAYGTCGSCCILLQLLVVFAITCLPKVNTHTYKHKRCTLRLAVCLLHAASTFVWKNT